jgi:hypothetical protein
MNIREIRSSINHLEFLMLKYLLSLTLLRNHLPMMTHNVSPVIPFSLLYDFCLDVTLENNLTKAYLESCLVPPGLTLPFFCGK